MVVLRYQSTIIHFIVQILVDYCCDRAILTVAGCDKFGNDVDRACGGAVCDDAVFGNMSWPCGDSFFANDSADTCALLKHFMHVYVHIKIPSPRKIMIILFIPSNITAAIEHVGSAPRSCLQNTSIFFSVLDPFCPQISTADTLTSTDRWVASTNSSSSGSSLGMNVHSAFITLIR